MSKTSLLSMVFTVAVLFSYGATCLAQPVSAAEYGKSLRSKPLFKQAHTGEGWCWKVSYSLGQLVQGYEVWKDASWLDEAVETFDLVVAKMDTGPDGYKGWVGPYGYDTKVWCDVHIGDSLLMNHLLSFAEIVHRDKALQPKYGAAADRYVELARKHLIEKWDARGTWREDGPYGGYVSWDTYCDPGKLDTWRKRGDTKNTGLSLPFNKQMDLGVACLRIWRITGQKKYWDKAQKIFSFFKSRMQFFDDHYVWNYWEPLGPWDIDEQSEKDDCKHWVQVHPERNYQAGEIDDIVEAYHSGMVFDRTDIERIVNTNLKVMWNGDREKPAFANSNNPHSKYRKPRKGKKAGTLWTGLFDFSKTVRDLHKVRITPPRGLRDRIIRAHFEQVTLKSPVSFKRQYAKDDVKVPEFLVNAECRDLHMAAVMPSVIRRGQKSIIISKAWTPDELEIALYSGDGKTKLAVLFKGRVPGGGDGHDGMFIYRWDGTDPGRKTEFSGRHRIRWTFRGGYREFPVTITK